MAEEFKEISPVYALNDYLWRLLQLKFDWSKVNNRVPIIPSGQQPEFTAYNQPYVVYGYAPDNGSNDLYVLSNDVVAYTIYGPSSYTTNQVAFMMSQAFRRYGESAADINNWIYSDSNPNSVYRDKKTHILWTEVQGGSDADAPETEGGMWDATVIVRYGYTMQFDDNEFDVR